MSDAAAPRVLVGPIDIAGIATGLVTGLRRLGLEADLVTAEEHPFRYDGVAPPAAGLPAWWRRRGAWHYTLPASHRVRKTLAALLQHAAGWLVLAWALPRYDAFVFLYGKTLTDTSLELRLLRAFGRRVVMVFVGSDARPPVIDGNLFPADAEAPPNALRIAMRRQQRKVQRLESLANVCVNAPATAQFHRRRVVNWFALGLPRVAVPATVPRPPGPVLRVLHSPSDPVLKGTANIVTAVDRLRARGVAIELVTLQDLPNQRVLEELADCDFVVDQLYSDTPMAAFATEAAAYGKPALVGGYFAAQCDTALAGLPMPPSLFVAPESFDTALERLSTDAALRRDLGQRARDFIAEQWRPEAVAERLLKLLRGDIPPSWWLEPASLSYVHGCGLHADVARQRVRSLVEAHGVAALGAADKPELQIAFLAFAGLSPAVAVPEARA